MQIQHIQVELVHSTSTGYTIRARVGISNEIYVEALAKEKKLFLAEESAIKRAKERLMSELDSKPAQSKLALSPVEVESPAKPTKQEKTKKPVEETKAPNAKASLKVEEKTSQKNSVEPQTALPDKPIGALSNKPKPKKKPKTEPKGFLTESERHRLAKERLQQVIEKHELTEQEVKAALTPSSWQYLSADELERVIVDFESGVPDAEKELLEKCCQTLLDCASTNTLRETWSKLRNAHWNYFSTASKLALFRAKEYAKGLLAGEELSAPENPIKATTHPDGHRETCKSCGAVIRWVTTKNGKPHPLNPGSKPVFLEGTGPSEKRFVILNGAAELVDTWPALPGAKGFVSSYESHFSTCPNASQHRNRGKKA